MIMWAPFIILMTIFGASCGTDESDHNLTDVVILASDNDYQANRALPFSYIVTFRAETERSSFDFSSFRHEFSTHFSPLALRYLSDPAILNMDHLAAVKLSAPTNSNSMFTDGFALPLGLRMHWNDKPNSEPHGVIVQVDFTSSEAAASTLKRWEKEGRIWFAEPNYESRHQASFRDFIEPYEAAATAEWHTSIKTLAALKWLADHKTIASQPIIAVMDSGVDAEHPTLAQRMWKNDAVGAADCAGDVYGCNTTAGNKGLLGNSDIFPFRREANGSCPIENGRSVPHCSHGTHVAGIIAGFHPDPAARNMVGVCPMCRIMAIRVHGDAPGRKEGSILDSSIIRGLNYVSRFRTGQGSAVRIITASFGKFQRSRAVGVLVQALYEQGHGTMVIAAAGNEDTMLTTYPAGFRDAMAVSNIHQQGAKHTTSNFGPWVDVAAPGDRIVSTVPGGGFEPKTGTSMSAPVVAGVAGLILASNPEMHIKELRKILVESANPNLYQNEVNQAYYVRIKGSNVRVPMLGSGLIDAATAVQGNEGGAIPIALGKQRVDGSCGVLAFPVRNGGWWSWLILLLPLTLARFKILAKQ